MAEGVAHLEPVLSSELHGPCLAFPSRFVLARPADFDVGPRGAPPCLQNLLEQVPQVGNAVARSAQGLCHLEPPVKCGFGMSIR